MIPGNCLYYALSDQLYGDFTRGEEIRLRLADHISSNPEYFMNFNAAVGEVRRAPRRAAKMSKYSSHTRSSPSSAPNPSDQDKERSFNDKVTESRKNGVWGGAEEIQACCQSFKKDVQVYTMYGVQTFRDVHAPEWEEREILHIAFHVHFPPLFRRAFPNMYRTSTTTRLFDIPKALTPECPASRRKDSNRETPTHHLLVRSWKWPLHGKSPQFKKASGVNMIEIQLSKCSNNAAAISTVHSATSSTMTLVPAHHPQTKTTPLLVHPTKQS